MSTYNETVSSRCIFHKISFYFCTIPIGQIKILDDKVSCLSQYLWDGRIDVVLPVWSKVRTAFSYSCLFVASRVVLVIILVLEVHDPKTLQFVRSNSSRVV